MTCCRFHGPAAEDHTATAVLVGMPKADKFQLFPIMGGKYHLVDKILELMPPHNTYIEPFGGALTVFLNKPRVPNEVVNDWNKELANLYHVVRDHCDELIERLTPLWYHRGIYEEWKAEYFLGLMPDNPVERAARYFYILNSCFNGDLRGGWKHSPQKNFGVPILIKRDLLPRISERFQGVQIECRDALEVIKDYDSEDACLYIDPPYAGITRDVQLKLGYTYYGDRFTHEDHVKLAEILHSIKGKVILSYYPSDLVDELYPDFYRYEYRLVKMSAHRIPGRRKEEVTELLLLNYRPEDIPKQLAFSEMKVTEVVEFEEESTDT